MDPWSIFVGFLQTVLLTFYNWTGNAGLAIIIFTIITRMIILPLTWKSLQSTRKMQELQPQVKEIQRKYGKDQQKLQEETMKLYRENKVSPVGGCLPMLLQFPIFIGVYQAVMNLTNVTVAEHAVSKMIGVLSSSGLHVTDLAQNLDQAKLAGGFLWLADLGQRDHTLILPILSVVLQLMVQLMATPRVQDPQQKMMAQTMLFMPIMFGYIGVTFPSGAVLYWVIGSILSVIQQYVISGWGSLANYLKFLPPDRGLFPPASPQPTSESVDTSDSQGAATQRLTFWDALRPLTEQGAISEESFESDVQTEQALREARRQAGQTSTRRRKTRH